MIDVLARALVSSFILCCVLSAAIQILAWSRHAKEGVRVSLRALWRPEDRFDEIGIRQIRLARRLLDIGIVAYLGYGALIVARTISQGT